MHILLKTYIGHFQNRHFVHNLYIITFSTSLEIQYLYQFSAIISKIYQTNGYIIKLMKLEFIKEIIIKICSTNINSQRLNTIHK